MSDFRPELPPVKVVRGGFATVYEVPIPDDMPTAGVCHWLLDAPGAHPFWRFHILVVVHLRKAEGVVDPVLEFPGASHELMVYALDPEHDEEVEVGDIHTQIHNLLSPPDVVVQFITADDEQARMVGAYAAQAVAHGMIVPDSDYQADWASGVHATAEHIRLKGHPPE